VVAAPPPATNHHLSESAAVAMCDGCRPLQLPLNS
jgi:hypothetical protein